MKKRPRFRNGLRVRNIRPLRNVYGVIAAGTKFTVDNSHGGLSLTGERCPHCGLRPSISKVSETDVEIVEE